jgi:hypothetical protein
MHLYLYKEVAMSSNTYIEQIEKQKVYSCADSAGESIVQTSTLRDLFTNQTGQTLVTLGKMFVNIPPFNDHIDRNTGQMLIAIGTKLKKKYSRIVARTT